MMLGASNLIDAVVRRAPAAGAALERLAIRSIAQPPAITADERAAARNDVRLAVAQLELMAIAACGLEVLVDHPDATRAEHMTWLRRTVGIDLDRAIRDLEPPSEETPTLDELARRAASDLERLLPYFRHRAASCPIEQIEVAARGLGDAEGAHRARRAYDALIAFLLRRDPSTHDKLRLVGRLYAAGQASLAECAALLGCPVPDAIVLLESRGYARTLDAVMLTDTARSEILRKLRAERLSRGGEPRVDPDRVRRNVIASERIEGIDARAWLDD